MSRSFEFWLSYNEIYSGVDLYLYEFCISCKFESRVWYELEISLIPKDLNEENEIILLGGNFGFDKKCYNLEGYNPLIDIYKDLKNSLDECFDYLPHENHILRKEDGLMFDDIIHFYVYKK